MSKLFVFSKAAVRGIIASVMVLIFISIIATLIINPESLNAEKNQVIGLIIGVLVSKLDIVVSFYFNLNQEKTDNE